MVYDIDMREVNDLGMAPGSGGAGALSAGPDPFCPEDGSLRLTAGKHLWLWPGDNASKLPVPNGQYVLVVKQSCQPELATHVWLQHKTASMGSASIAPNPASGGAFRVCVKAQPGVSAQVRIYNLAGEEVAFRPFPPGSLSLACELRSPSGQALAPGIYLVKIRLATSDAAVQWITQKLAVLGR